MKTFVSNLKQIMISRNLDNEKLSKLSCISVEDIETILLQKKAPLPSQIVSISTALNIFPEKLLFSSPGIPKNFDCRLLALDVDGVMTDGGMYIGSDQKEWKKFSTRDGLAIKMALRQGIEVGFISNGRNIDLIGYRAEMLGVKRLYVGTDEKMPVLQSWCSELGISLQQVAYIGDDINDKEIISHVGLGACPADAEKAIMAVAKVVLNTAGGQGCVRELASMLGWIE